MAGQELDAMVRHEDRERWWSIHDKERYLCPDCGRSQSEVKRFDVHHIDAEPHKIVGLCQECHMVRHGAERKKISIDAWKEEFLALGG